MPVVSMEKGLFALCKQDIERKGDFTLKGEGTVDNEVFREHRLHRFLKTVEYVYEKSKWYRDIMDEMGVKPEDIKSMDDIKKLPFTAPSDIARGGYKFLCISQSGVEKPVTFVSTGTTGPQKSMYFSYKDIGAITDFLGTGMHTMAQEGDSIHILLPDSAVRGIGTLLAEGVGKHGMKGYSAGLSLPSEEQMALCLEHKPVLWFGDARVIYRITKESEKIHDLKSLGVKTMFTTISEVSPSMRRNLEEAWGCKVVTHYGLTESGYGLAVDCPDGDGFHYNEFDIIVELLDPETGEPVAEGEEGEVVLTTLGREAMPLIRYRTHDISTIKKGPCKCGAMLDSLGHVARRLEAIVEIDGMELYPTKFDDLMFSNSCVVDYEIYHRAATNELYFEVECIHQPEGYEKVIAETMAKHEFFKGKAVPEVKILPSGALKSGAEFKKLIREV